MSTATIAVVTSTALTSKRAAATARSIVAHGACTCVVVDVDGTRVSTDAAVEVLDFGDVCHGLGVEDAATRAALTLDPEQFAFYAGVLTAAFVEARTAGAYVAVIAAGVYVLGPLDGLATGDGLGVLPFSDARTVGGPLVRPGRLEQSARQFWPIAEPVDDSGRAFSRSLVFFGPRADARAVAVLAGDWHVAPQALELALSAQDGHIIRKETAFLSARRGTGGLALVPGPRGGLVCDGTEVTALDLTGYDPEVPSLIDGSIRRTPALRMSEHPALLPVVAQWAAALDAEMTAPDHLARPLIDPALRTELRRTDLLGAALPEIRGFGAHDDRDALIAWATAPVPPSHRRPVARYLAGIRATRPRLERNFPQIPGDDSPRLARWALRQVGKDDFDDELLRASADATLAAQQETPTATGPRPAGVNVVGYLSGELGLGVSGRLMTTALRKADVPVSTFDVSGALPHRTTAAFEATSSGVYDTTLYCVNGPEIAPALRQLGDIHAGTYRIGMWYWEIEDFPPSQRNGIQHVDEIWAATDFMREAMARHAGNVPVRTVMPPLPQRGDAVVPDLPPRFGIPIGRPYFLFTFDYLSYAERKNPEGLVRAFCKAFPTQQDDGPLLVIKTVNGNKVAADSERLLLLTNERPDIVVIDEYLPNDERHVLVAHCTAYVSLHRAEGLGLTIAEAMAWGKPVIATRYGGPTQFMTAENSFGVGYEKSTIRTKVGPYPAGSHWAEPDIAEAARLMQKVVSEPDLAAQVGARAARDILERHNADVAGQAISDALAAARERACKVHAESRTLRSRIAARRAQLRQR